MRWKCKVAYDGTDYCGWQSQPGGRTIQDLIEARLASLFHRRVDISCSGRTDTGVHARGQVFHFDAEWRHPPELLLRALRVGYPASIQVYDVVPVDAQFHARFSATGKRYSYRLYEGYASPFEGRWCWSLRNRRVDEGKMNEAAEQLLGLHDFSAFTVNPRDDRSRDYVRELRRLDVCRDGPRLTVTTEARGYLYRMARSLVGCLVDVGIGKLSVAEVVSLRDRAVRTEKIQTAPAQGLCLEEVFYAD